MVPSPRSFPEKGRGISGRKYEAIRPHSLKFSEHTRPSLRKEILIDRASWFALFGFLSRNSHS